jgi:hypothetical protein
LLLAVVVGLFALVVVLAVTATRWLAKQRVAEVLPKAKFR